MSTKRFNVGDFVEAPGKVILEVVGIVENVYGFSRYGYEGINWMTESEVEDFNKTTIDFSAFDNARVGDMVETRPDKYRKILAKVGDVVLLSETSSEQAKKVLEFIQTTKKLGAKLSKELGDSPDILIDEDDLTHLKNHASMRKMHDIADEWYTTKQMVLLNWKLVSE